MNTLISGQIGAGKTYFAIKNFILPALVQGRYVYTNIDFGHKWDFELSARFSVYLNKDCSSLIKSVVDTKQFLDMLRLLAYDERGSKLPYHSLVVIDEAHQVFNYLQTNYISKQVWEFLAYSRHFGIDLVFITQSPELLSKFVINLCNNYIYVYGMKNTSRLFGNTFFYEEYAGYGGVKIKKSVQKYDQKIFQLYRSFLGDSDSSVVKRPILPEGWQKPAILVLIFVLFFGYAVLNISKNYLFKF